MTKAALETYYDQAYVTVQRATVEDAGHVAKYMREQDKDEIWAAAELKPRDAVDISMQSFCLSVRKHDVPLCLFGVNGETLLGERGVVWMLSTDGILDIGLRFARNSPIFVDMMLDRYPYLHNWVDDRNTVSKAWLRWLGAEMMPPCPHGVKGKLFQYFWFERK